MEFYNQNQEPNPTGNISLMLDSKWQLMVLVLHVLLLRILVIVQSIYNFEINSTL